MNIRRRQSNFWPDPVDETPEIDEDEDDEDDDDFDEFDEDDEPDPPAKYSDIALQNRFVKEHGRDLQFVKEIGQWFVYNEQESRWGNDKKMFPWRLTKRMLAEVASEVVSGVFAHHDRLVDQDAD